MSPIRYIRAHPFSTMALCNIVGDLGYLGYAFAAEGFVSLPKLTGACFTMLAHVTLLAYGDEQAKAVASEKGYLSGLVLGLRAKAQNIMHLMPAAMRECVRRKPVGVAFSMLAVNGCGLLMDALPGWREGITASVISQSILGSLITIGTCTFAAADFVKGQRTADVLTKAAPAILACASIANVGLAVTTWNPFVVTSVMAFAVSNFAGFYTRINKEKGQHLHS